MSVCQRLNDEGRELCDFVAACWCHTANCHTRIQVQSLGATLCLLHDLIMYISERYIENQIDASASLAPASLYRVEDTTEEFLRRAKIILQTRHEKMA